MGADADRRVVAAQDPRGDLRAPTAGTSRRPIRDLPPEAVDYLLYAKKDEKVIVRYRHERGENTYKATFEGVVTNLERRYRETDSEYVKTELEKFMVARPCPTCGGKRLRPGDPGGHHRRPEHLGRLDDVDHGRAALGDGARRRP